MDSRNLRRILAVGKANPLRTQRHAFSPWGWVSVQPASQQSSKAFWRQCRPPNDVPARAEDARNSQERLRMHQKHDAVMR